MSGSSTRLAPRRVTGWASNAAKRVPSAEVSSTGPCSPISLDFGGAGGRWSLEKHMCPVCGLGPGRATAGGVCRAGAGAAYLTGRGRPVPSAARGGSDVDPLAVQCRGRVDDEVLERRDVVAHEQVEDP